MIEEKSLCDWMLYSDFLLQVRYIQVAHFVSHVSIIHKYRFIYNNVGPLPTSAQ